MAYDESDQSDDGSEQDGDSSSASYADQDGGDGQGDGSTGAESVSNAEAQAEPPSNGDEVTLSDDDIAGILRDAGVEDDGGDQGGYV